MTSEVSTGNHTLSQRKEVTHLSPTTILHEAPPSLRLRVPIEMQYATRIPKVIMSYSSAESQLRLLRTDVTRRSVVLDKLRPVERRDISTLDD